MNMVSPASCLAVGGHYVGWVVYTGRIINTMFRLLDCPLLNDQGSLFGGDSNLHKRPYLRLDDSLAGT